MDTQLPVPVPVDPKEALMARLDGAIAELRAIRKETFLSSLPRADLLIMVLEADLAFAIDPEQIVGNLA